MSDPVTKISRIEETDLDTLKGMKRRCIGRILEVKDELDIDEDDADHLRRTVLKEIDSLFDVMMMYLKQEGKVNRLYYERLDDIHNIITQWG